MLYSRPLADKIASEEGAEQGLVAKLPMGEFVHRYYSKVTGLIACADVQTAQLFKACEVQSRLPRVAVFIQQVGLLNKDDYPPLDVRDTDFILAFLRTVAEQQQEQLHMQQMHDLKSAHKVFA